MITSRDPLARDDGLATNGIQIKPFTQADGAAFFLSFLERPEGATPDDQAVAKALTDRFSGLPIALRIAAAYTRRKNITPATFSRMYDDRRKEIDECSVPGGSTNLAGLWPLVLDNITCDAAELLDLLVFLDPDEIPVDLFSTANFDFLGASEWLWTRSLVEYDGSKSFLKLNRYFQSVRFERICQDEERYNLIFGKVLDCLLISVPELSFIRPREPERWETTERYLSHVMALELRSRTQLPPQLADRLLSLLIRFIQ